jgi:hypothetical protein
VRQLPWQRVEEGSAAGQPIDEATRGGSVARQPVDGKERGDGATRCPVSEAGGKGISPPERGETSVV